MVSGSYPDYIITGTDNVDDADNDPTNELQTLDLQGASVTLSNDGGTISIEDADADPLNEIQNASEVSVTPSGTLISNDVQNALEELQGEIIADPDQNATNELNTGGSFQLNNTVRISDVGGDIDIPIGTLNADLDANFNRLTNLAEPSSGQDAVTKNYLDVKDATDYAFKVPIGVLATASDFSFDLASNVEFNEGNLISGLQLEIVESGVYTFIVKGETNTSGADLYISIQSVDTKVLKPSALNYNDTFIFKLNANDIVELKATGATIGAFFNLEFFGYKL
jgi:hypothetical protein